MPRKYRHLSRDERSQIFVLRKDGKSNREIGRIVGRCHTTIGRELSRNSDERGYRPASAHRYSEDRRHPASSVPWKLTPELWRYISKEITKHSPDLVSGCLLRDGGTSVSASWIYFCIHCDRFWGGELFLHLPHGGKKLRRLKDRYSGRCRIPNRVDISERPAIVDEKSRIGDFEEALQAFESVLHLELQSAVDGGNLRQAHSVFLLGAVRCWDRGIFLFRAVDVLAHAYLLYSGDCFGKSGVGRPCCATCVAGAPFPIIGRVIALSALCCRWLRAVGRLSLCLPSSAGGFSVFAGTFFPLRCFSPDRRLAAGRLVPAKFSGNLPRRADDFRQSESGVSRGLAPVRAAFAAVKRRRVLILCAAYRFASFRGAVCVFAARCDFL